MLYEEKVLGCPILVLGWRAKGSARFNLTLLVCPLLFSPSLSGRQAGSVSVAKHKNGDCLTITSTFSF